MRVALFVTCLTDLFYPDVAAAVVRVLRRLGVQVDFPPDQTCCGQPALNSGFMDEFRAVAARMIDVFASAEMVVTPSGSCASIVREHIPHAFDNDPALRARAQALAARTYEFVEFLDKVVKPDWSKWELQFPAVATYHYSCHLRGLGMTDEAVRLLQRIGGIEYRPLEKLDQCCGFGGTFAVKYGDISGAMVRDKIACVRATGADLLMVNDGGCAMNIAGALNREGTKIRVMHIAEILDQAMQGSGSRVRGSGSRVHGSGLRVEGSGLRVEGSGARVQGSGAEAAASPPLTRGGQGGCEGHCHCHESTNRQSEISNLKSATTSPVSNATHPSPPAPNPQSEIRNPKSEGVES